MNVYHPPSYLTAEDREMFLTFGPLVTMYMDSDSINVVITSEHHAKNIFTALKQKSEHITLPMLETPTGLLMLSVNKRENFVLDLMCRLFADRKISAEYLKTSLLVMRMGENITNWFVLFNRMINVQTRETFHKLIAAIGQRTMYRFNHLLSMPVKCTASTIHYLVTINLMASYCPLFYTNLTTANPSKVFTRPNMANPFHWVVHTMVANGSVKKSPKSGYLEHLIGILKPIIHLNEDIDLYVDDLETMLETAPKGEFTPLKVYDFYFNVKPSKDTPVADIPSYNTITGQRPVSTTSYTHGKPSREYRTFTKMYR